MQDMALGGLARAPRSSGTTTGTRCAYPDRWSHQWDLHAIAQRDRPHRAHPLGVRLLFLMLLATASACYCSQVRMTQVQGVSYDSRVYDVCGPWNGARGDPFVRRFAPDFQNGVEAVTDDEGFNLKDHVLGTDQGSRAPNGIPYAGAAAARAIQAKAWRNRGSKV